METMAVMSACGCCTRDPTGVHGLPGRGDGGYIGLPCWGRAEDQAGGAQPKIRELQRRETERVP